MRVKPVAGVVAAMVAAAATSLAIRSNDRNQRPEFRPSSPALLASTGRPQLVEFFHHL